MQVGLEISGCPFQVCVPMVPGAQELKNPDIILLVQHLAKQQPGILFSFSSYSQTLLLCKEQNKQFEKILLFNYVLLAGKYFNKI